MKLYQVMTLSDRVIKKLKTSGMISDDRYKDRSASTNPAE